MGQNIIEDYTQRAAFANIEAQKYKKLANTYSLYRLAAFGLFILCICLAIYADEMLIIVFALVVLIICFSWLVKKQNHFEILKHYWLDIKKVNENEISSIVSNMNIYDNGAAFCDDKHHYTADLDIFGNGSLYQLVNRSATFPGMVKLAQWFNTPSNKATILLRQQAIIEIAKKNDWKLELQAFLLFSLKQQRGQIKNLLGYLKLPVTMEDEKWLSLYVKAAPWLLTALIIGAVFYVPFRYLIPVAALLNNRLVAAKAEVIDKTDLIAGRIGKTLEHFVLAFKSIEEEEWQCEYLKNLSIKIKDEQSGSISGKIEQLSILINKLNYRLNLLVKLVLNIFFLWDIRQILAIEGWKKANHQNFKTAFETIAEFEAIISLAGLHINYPAWCLPHIESGDGYTLIANDMAHPLINPDKRVQNNYQLAATFKIDIVTGSNMAGKSTFLRTIGINTVLALCGAPACARDMKISVISIITYMRIKDSLNESTSTFKAELDRLQMLLAAVESGEKIFFLIDEMLRGTNSVDKYLGSKAVIERLISKKGVGLVATHDLQIAELETEYPDYIRNFYFDIQVKNDEMLFDYKIKHGACKTFNASLLLKQIGINVTGTN